MEWKGDSIMVCGEQVLLADIAEIETFSPSHKSYTGVRFRNKAGRVLGVDIIEEADYEIISKVTGLLSRGRLAK